MDVTPGMQLIRRHLRLVAMVGLITAGLAFAGSYLWSPRYTARTHVLVHARDARFMTNQGQGLTGQSGVIDQSLATSLDETHASLLASRALSIRVVDDLHLDHLPENTSPLGRARAAVRKVKAVVWDTLSHGFYAEPTPREGAISLVQASLKATPIKNSFIVEIAASADDPKLAAAIADAATAELITLNQQRDQADSLTYAKFLKDQVDIAATNVQTTADAVRKYKQDHGITDVNEQLLLDAQSDQKVRDDLRDTDVALASARAQVASLQSSLDGTSSTDQSSSTVTTGRSTTTTTQTNSNTIYSNLKAQLAATQSQVAALQAKHDSLTQLLTQPVSSLPAQQAGLGALELKAKAASDAYSALQAAYQGALVNSAQNSVELSRVDTAGVPLYPEGPARYLFLVVGLLIGLMGGTALAWWRERRETEGEIAPLRQAGRPRLAPQPSMSLAADPGEDVDTASAARR